MTKRRPRGLSTEERQLWKRVADQTVPLHPQRKTSEPAQILQQHADPKEKPKTIEPFEMGQNAGATSMPQPKPTAPTVNIGRKANAQLKRGKIRPEGKLDLHGMTLDQAHPRLTRFLFDQHEKGRRLVLVITGKGKERDEGGPIPVRRGILRHHVPQWLATPPLSGLVLQTSPAHIRHGGDGALYVYLRRRR